MPEQPDTTLQTPQKQDQAVQEQIDRQKEATGQQFGTFGGVFTPTLLTILGVIMYLREGWVVGNAGLAGAWAIILLSFGITAATGLSLSSIVTNIRIGAGGAFSIISQSLGLEVGGSVGVPLYLSQALAVSMYIFGFRAGWLWIFPEHDPLYVDLSVFAVLFLLAFVSAKLAFKVQYLILAVIIASLVSVAGGVFTGVLDQPIFWLGDFKGAPETGFTGTTFWAVFAVFFPASTGIMAGANMSGELKDPRKSIPIGTMSAIGISLVVYLALAWWLVKAAPRQELLENYTVMIDKALYGPLVLAGLLGATFSSALASLVGAPRIMQALAEHGILPKSSLLAAKTSGGEPRNAMLVTGVLVLGALMLRDLNAVAPLITMFFLITYAMINAVVFIEQSLGLVSFRPLFRIPRAVSLAGAAGCLLAMFIVNAPAAGGAVVVVLAIHWVLVRRHLRAPFGDVRSGLFVALAEWAARSMADLTASRERTWRSNLLVPMEQPSLVADELELIHQVAYPKGLVKLVGLTGRARADQLRETLEDLKVDLNRRGVFATWALVESAAFSTNLQAGIETLRGQFFKPNVLFMLLPQTRDREDESLAAIAAARKSGMGVLVYAPAQGKTAELPTEWLAPDILLHIPNRGTDWSLSMELGNLDLALLTAYKVAQGRKGALNFVASYKGEDNAAAAEEFCIRLADLARMPGVGIFTRDLARPKTLAEAGPDMQALPEAGLHVLPMDEHPDLEALRRTAAELGGPCLFALDSGDENALA